MRVDVQFGPINHDRRKYFLKDRALPLGCGDCGETPDGSNRWQLFIIGEEASITFMKECDLSNLQFPIQIAGVILIAENRGLEKRWRAPYLEIDWAVNQKLPLVIAAVGYAETEFSPEAFREQFGLARTFPLSRVPPFVGKKSQKLILNLRNAY